MLLGGNILSEVSCWDWPNSGGSKSCVRGTLSTLKLAQQSLRTVTASVPRRAVPGQLQEGHHHCLLLPSSPRPRPRLESLRLTPGEGQGPLCLFSGMAQVLGLYEGWGWKEKSSLPLRTQRFLRSPCHWKRLWGHSPEMDRGDRELRFLTASSWMSPGGSAQCDFCSVL